jgi:hypothetical protein
MPDEIVIGKMRITRTRIAAPPANDPDQEKVLGLVKIDCRPPPGSTTEFVRPNMLSPFVIERFLQPREEDRLISLGLDATDIKDTFDDLVARILGGLGFRPLPVDYGKPYRDLLTIVPCYTVDVFMRVRYDLYDVKVVAAEDVTVGGTSFPAGDELASFRVADPLQYRFETETTFNPRCCAEEPQAPPNERQSAWLPTPLEFGPRIEWHYDKDWSDDDNRWRPRLRLKRSFGE